MADVITNPLTFRPPCTVYLAPFEILPPVYRPCALLHITLRAPSHHPTMSFIAPCVLLHITLRAPSQHPARSFTASHKYMCYVHPHPTTPPPQNTWYGKLLEKSFCNKEHKRWSTTIHKHKILQGFIKEQQNAIK